MCKCFQAPTSAFLIFWFFFLCNRKLSLAATLPDDPEVVEEDATVKDMKPLCDDQDNKSEGPQPDGDDSTDLDDLILEFLRKLEMDLVTSLDEDLSKLPDHPRTTSAQESSASPWISKKIYDFAMSLDCSNILQEIMNEVIFFDVLFGSAELLWKLLEANNNSMST